MKFYSLLGVMYSEIPSRKHIYRSASLHAKDLLQNDGIPVPFFVSKQGTKLVFVVGEEFKCDNIVWSNHDIIIKVADFILKRHVFL